MRKMSDDKSYLAIVDHILNDKNFNELKNFPHHSTNRLVHSMRVSYCSYRISKSLRLDCKATAISGLLHDFYLCEEEKGFIKYLIFQNKHPQISSHNATNYFKVSSKEKNIIETHMFPFTKPSRYPEGWVVSLADKIIWVYEYTIVIVHKIFK